MKAIDNFKKIIRLLKFEKEGDFYQVIILTRKKDQDVPANHQSSRTIKTYMFESVEQLIGKKKEIMKLCKMFNARAGISPNVLNHNDLAFDVNVAIATRLKDGHKNFAYLYDTVIGQSKSRDKRWLIDLDEKNMLMVAQLCQYVLEQAPHKGIITILPTYNGYHLVTYPFNSIDFNTWVKANNIDASIHKTNYIALYYPPKKNLETLLKSDENSKME